VPPCAAAAAPLLLLLLLLDRVAALLAMLGSPWAEGLTGMRLKKLPVQLLLKFLILGLLMLGGVAE
jgi:hypothetical protein